MRRQTKIYIESLLDDYPNYYEHRDKRRFELTHPVAQIDENVGGGRAQNKVANPILSMIITVDEDDRLNNLRKEHDTIRVCYEEANNIVKKICDELYFKKPALRKYHSIHDMCIDKQLNIAQAQAYRMFNDFCEQIAKELGLHL